MNTIKLAFLTTLLTLLTACSSFEKLSTWVSENDESMVLIRIATSEVLLRGTSMGTAIACERADRGVEFLSQSRKVINNPLLSLVDIDKELQQAITNAGVSPITAAILFDIAKQAVNNHEAESQIGAIPEDAKVTFNSVISAVSGVVHIVKSGC